MLKLRLMADYNCHPLWDEGASVGNVDPGDLLISAELKRDLVAWAHAYDATLCSEDPRMSGFRTPEEEQRFESEGAELWRRLRLELGSGARVRYFCSRATLEPEDDSPQ